MFLNLSVLVILLSSGMLVRRYSQERMEKNGGGAQLGDGDVLGGRLVLVDFSEDGKGKGCLLCGVFVTVFVGPILLL